MILYDPFFIGPRLLPALKVGNGTLILASVSWNDKRMEFGFYLDTPDFKYFDARVRSGCGGCSLVEAFETFLWSLKAAVDSYNHEKSENTDPFPPHVVKWAAAQTYLEETHSSICDENGDVLHHLIKE